MATWIKALDGLPGKPGKENKVIIRDITNGLICYGFKNFDKENPALYFEVGNKSFLAVHGEGNGSSTYPIKNLEWLNDSEPSFTLQDMKDCWEAASEWGAEETVHDNIGMKVTSPNEEEYFKQKFNIDISK